MFYLAIVMQWIHLLSAITAIGGTIILRAVVHPAAQKLEGDTRVFFEKNVKRNLTKFIHSSIFLLFLTGLFNLDRVRREGVHFMGVYGLIFLVKFALAMGLFWIAIALTISSDALEKFQTRRSFYMTINILLGIAIVLLSAWLRMLNSHL